MARPRVPSHALWYHAMNRVDGEAVWLSGREQALAFLSRLSASSAGFAVELHAYCVLPRHYHLLVRAVPEALRGMVAHLEEGFALGDGRSRAVPVTYGRHLMGVSRYIHLNPVAAGLVNWPEQWPFSSLGAYLGDINPPVRVETEAVLGRFGTIGARHRHRAYVHAGLDPDTRDLDGRPRWPELVDRGWLGEELAWRIEPVLTRAPRDAPRRPAAVPFLDGRTRMAT